MCKYGVGDRLGLTASLPAAPTGYGGTTAYTYDGGLTGGRGQVTQEASTRGGGYTLGSAYDGGSGTGPGNPTTFRGAAHAFNADNQDTANTYDGDGSPTTVGTDPATFDPANRLTAVGYGYGLRLAATYRGDGLRASKTVPVPVDSFKTTYYLYDGSVPVCELDGTGAVTATDTFGAHGLVSRRVGGASAFYTFDPQGNTAQRLSATGAVLSSDRDDAFGGVTGTAASPDVFGFSGQWGGYTDAETGLVLMTHRYYDPASGRFLTRDPMGYDGDINLSATRSPYAAGFPCRRPLRVWLPKRAKPSASLPGLLPAMERSD